MNFKNVKAERTTLTRNTEVIEELGTGNLFETIVILSKRSNQLSQDLKKELAAKMEEFVIPNDTLEEVFENREQIEISKFYERLAKPHSIAIKELEDSQIYYRREEKVEELDLELSEASDTEASDDKTEEKSGKKAEEKTEEKKAEDNAS
jgi:DNA-directed RNA polymerase subunit K/omega